MLIYPPSGPKTTAVTAKGDHGLPGSLGLVVWSWYAQQFDFPILVLSWVPAVKEPQGLLRSDGKCPDGVTLIPWKTGRCLVRDETVEDTLAPSNLLHQQPWPMQVQAWRKIERIRNSFIHSGNSYIVPSRNLLRCDLRPAVYGQTKNNDFGRFMFVERRQIVPGQQTYHKLDPIPSGGADHRDSLTPCN